MRYTRMGRATYAIGFLLLAAAFLFAWTRSQHRRSPPILTPGAAFSWRTLGSEVYAAECRSCHRQGGKVGTLPPLSGYAVELFVSPKGRDYLVHFLLTGDVRKVEDGKDTLVDDHPPFDHLDDSESAAVLNHMLTAFGNEALLPANARLYEPADIAPHRR